MSFFQSIFSSLSSVLDGDHANYASWGQTVEKKVTALAALLAPLMGKIDHVGQLQQNLNQVQVALVDLLPDLSVDTYSGEARNLLHIQHARGCLLHLWSNLLLSLDKVEEMRFTLLFLDVIWRIMTRPEFDIEYLVLDDHGVPHTSQECSNAFKRYGRLIQNTHAYISTKLADANPAMNSSILLKLELLMAYSRILSVCFFRLPEVSKAIIKSLKTSSQLITYDLKAFEYNEVIAALASAGALQAVAKTAVPTPLPEVMIADVPPDSPPLSKVEGFGDLPIETPNELVDEGTRGNETNVDVQSLVTETNPQPDASASIPQDANVSVDPVEPKVGDKTPTDTTQSPAKDPPATPTKDPQTSPTKDTKGKDEEPKLVTQPTKSIVIDKNSSIVKSLPTERSISCDETNRHCFTKGSFHVPKDPHDLFRQHPNLFGWALYFPTLEKHSETAHVPCESY